MTPAEIIQGCLAEGVSLALSPAGTIKARGDGANVERWLPLIRDHKAALLAALRHQDETEDLREHFEERAGILEYDAGLPRAEAELEAARITATYARNVGYSWTSLRMAFAAYPELLASLPEKAGLVDSLPLGVSKVAVLSGKPVLKARCVHRRARGEGINLTALLAEACQGVEGIDAATFRALLSPEDVKDIVGGHIPMVTLNAYARSFAEGIRVGRIKVLAAAIPKPAITERVRCAP